MKMSYLLLNLIFLAKINHTTNEWIFLIFIQILIASLFFFTVSYFCRQLKKKEPEKANKKTCILISFLSAIGWFIIAQIVWVITTIQLSGA